jgi:hypothetical protein
LGRQDPLKGQVRRAPRQSRQSGIAIRELHEGS